MKLQRNQDGTLSAGAVQQLEEALLATTDQIGSLMDMVLQKGFVPAFVCNHSGLLLPGDMVKNWGRDGYGIGLGPDPVSEVLDTNYELDLPDITPQIRRIDQIMHPVGYCMSQIDRVMVSPSEFEARKAILERDDQQFIDRAKILREKQMKNPKGRIHILAAKFR